MEKQMFKGKRAYFAEASLARQNAKVKWEKVLTRQHRPDLPASIVLTERISKAHKFSFEDFSGGILSYIFFRNFVYCIRVQQINDFLNGDQKISYRAYPVGVQGVEGQFLYG
jgi:hypothetical protein